MLARVISCLGLLLAVSPVSAQSLPPRIALRATPADASAELARQLSVELRADGVGEVVTDFEVEAVARLTVDERSEGVFEVTVEDLATDKRVSRTVELEGIDGEVRSRALAIAVAELLRASWLELATMESHEIPEAAPAEVVQRVRTRLARALGVPADSPARAPRPDAPSSACDLGLITRGYPTTGLWLLGARFGGGLPILVEWLALRGDIAWLGGSATDPLGTIDLWQLTFAVALQLGTEIGPVRVAVGPRIEGGIAWAAGRPANPAVMGGQGGDVLVLGGLEAVGSVRVVDWLRVGARVSADWTFSGLSALVEGVPSTGMVEGTFAAALELSAELD